MVLIGLMGGKGSGKTTAASYLIDRLGFTERSFADPLKKACKELFLLSDEQIYGTQEQKETPDDRWFGCTPRKMLQYVGTDLLRDYLDNIMPGLHKNVFTHHFRLWYHDLMVKNPHACVVISDVRFQNEADFIKELGGYLIKIDRPGIASNDTHPSEVELRSIKSYDIVLINNKTIEEFYCQIMSCVDNASQMN